MKHFPRPLISFRNLRGGQFGTLDVSAISPHAVQLALGSDFVCTTREQWLRLRESVDRYFGTERWSQPETVDAGQGVSFEQRDVEEGDEEVLEVPAPPPPRQGKAQRSRRGRTASV